jgi:3-oxoacyl-[acyl-carrier protein] reductase
VISSERKTVLITGGTRGIGLAIVHRLIEEGWNVALTYRSNAAVAEELLANLKNKTSSEQQVQLYFALRSLPEKIASDFGRLDALVNNAGMTDDGAFLTMDSARWERVLKANFSGTAHLCLASIPILLRQKNPAIVVMASLAGLTGKEDQVAYATSKGALIGLTQWLGRRYGKEGLRINAIAPGFIHTEMVDVLEPKMYNHILAGTSLNRMGKVDEVASTVNFLLQPGYVQSTTLRIDGGFKR